jgi:ACS family hexuronate transporter-like MFS transporter
MLFPIVTGILLDSFKASGNVVAGYGILFAFCAGAYLFSLVLLQLLNPRLEPVRFRNS